MEKDEQMDGDLDYFKGFTGYTFSLGLEIFSIITTTLIKYYIWISFL